MKKIIALFTIFILFTQTAIYSEVIQKISEERGYISVNAQKEKEVFPNIAQITFKKESSAKTLQEASNENKKAIEKINTELAKYLTEGTEIIKGSYSATPVYNYKSNQRNIQSYLVVNTITVRTKNTQNLGKMIDSAITAGADSVNSLSFSYENDGTICRNLLSEATKEAKTIADATAKSTNDTIKGIKSIHTSCSTSTSSYNNLYRSFAKFNSTNTQAETIETNIETGKMKITASVNANFYVK